MDLIPDRHHAPHFIGHGMVQSEVSLHGAALFWDTWKMDSFTSIDCEPDPSSMATARIKGCRDTLSRYRNVISSSRGIPHSPHTEGFYCMLTLQKLYKTVCATGVRWINRLPISTPQLVPSGICLDFS